MKHHGVAFGVDPNRSCVERAVSKPGAMEQYERVIHFVERPQPDGTANSREAPAWSRSERRVAPPRALAHRKETRDRRMAQLCKPSHGGRERNVVERTAGPQNPQYDLALEAWLNACDDEAFCVASENAPNLKLAEPGTGRWAQTLRGRVQASRDRRRSRGR